MGYSNKLRALFPDTVLTPEDLLLLEAFQIRYLPDRVPTLEFVTLIRAYPVIHRFLVAKSPSIDLFIDQIMSENDAVEDHRLMEEYCQEALWEIADLIVYNKHPDIYDAQARIHWDIEEIHAITSLEGKVVADVGAGSGRIAFLVAPNAETVFAFEPITSFRSFMKEKAAKEKVENLFVMDGTLDSIPLPNDSLDVLITSNAIGWNLPAELKEIERVVMPGGHAIHLLWSDEPHDNPFHETLTSARWNYSCLQSRVEKVIKITYSKMMLSK